MMKAWLIPVTLMVFGTLAGCGGGGSGNSIANNLTQAQARQVGTTVSNDASKALTSAVGNPAVPLDITTRDNMLVALQGNNSQAVSQPEQVTCSGTSCTVSGTYNCPDSGSIMVMGNFMVTAMSATGTFTETFSGCSDGTLVIDGTVMATVTGNNDGMTTTVSVMISGTDISFKPVQAGQFPTGSSCSLSVHAIVSVSDSSGSVTPSLISGSICGQTIN
jgi:hypothetical protein